MNTCKIEGIHTWKGKVTWMLPIAWWTVDLKVICAGLMQ